MSPFLAWGDFQACSLSLRKNGGLLVVQQGVNVCIATPLQSNLGLKVQYVTKPLILSLGVVFF